MKNKIEDLRNHLFATAQVASLVVESAKAEVKFLEATSGYGGK